MILQNIKKFFKKNKGNPNAVIDDEMRLKGLEVRQQNARIRQLERQHESQKKLEILEEAITGVKKGNPLEEMFMKIVMTQLTKSKEIPQEQGIIYGDNATSQQQGSLDENTISILSKAIGKKLSKDDRLAISKISDVDMVRIKNKLIE